MRRRTAWHRRGVSPLRSRWPWLLLVPLFACAPRVGVTREAAGELSLMRLLPVREADLGWSGELEPGENRFGLNLLGIFAEGENVFLSGGLVFGGRPYRSTVLTSHDSGVTWRETLAPYENSEITQVQFVGCTGWAIAGWKQDGPGDLILLGSGDCGKEWFTLSELPKTDPSGWPVALEFEDTFNGVITLAYQAPDLERGYLRTGDGGRTWQETLARARADEPGRTRWEFTSGSGEGWKLESQRGHYVVSRRPNAQTPWRVAAVLPGWLRVEDGEFRPLAR